MVSPLEHMRHDLKEMVLDAMNVLLAASDLGDESVYKQISMLTGQWAYVSTKVQLIVALSRSKVFGISWREERCCIGHTPTNAASFFYYCYLS